MEQSTAQFEELLTVKEAAKILKVTPKTLYKWGEAGKIRLIKIAGTFTRVTVSDLTAFIANAPETAKLEI